MTRADIPKETKVLSRDGKQEGETTGSARFCQLEGCGGLAYAVRWPGGKLTWPCVKGLKGLDDGRYQIE